MMDVDMIFNGFNLFYDKWEGIVFVMVCNVMVVVKENCVVYFFIGNVYNYGKEIGF